MPRTRSPRVRRSVLLVLTAVLGPLLTLVAPAAPATAILDGSISTHAPWAVRIYEKGRPICTGVLVADQWVLTAGHCVRYDNVRVTVRVGSLRAAQGRQVRRLDHATYFTRRADVALVKIPAVRAPHLPLTPRPSGSRLRVGRTATVYGWGATCEPDEASCQSRRLRQADVTVIPRSDDRCYLLAGRDDICAERGTGLPVGGDSGAPVVATQHGKPRLVGIFTASDRTEAVAAADVARIKHWIRATIRRH